jgi:hypothetical protein
MSAPVVVSQGCVLTAMNVAGKKNNVTVVMTRIDTVSCLVFFAISCISVVIVSIWSADCCALCAKAALVCTLRCCNIPLS